MKTLKNIRTALLVMVFNMISSTILYKSWFFITGGDGKSGAFMAIAFCAIWIFGAIASADLTLDNWEK